MIAGTAREVPGFQNTAYVASKRAYDAGLRTLADLPGHSVGITQTGSTFHYSLGLLANKLKFDIATVRVVALQSLPNVAAAIKGGQLDAALTAATTITPVVASGDAIVLGGKARLAFHGVDRILPGTSTLLPEGGRINLTLRRVTMPGEDRAW